MTGLNPALWSKDDKFLVPLDLAEITVYICHNSTGHTLFIKCYFVSLFLSTHRDALPEEIY
jgi:hypothetical protein